jgi:rRNA-processing protein FCF1
MLSKKRMPQNPLKTDALNKKIKLDEQIQNIPQNNYQQHQPKIFNTTNINNNNIRLEMSKAYIANNFKGYSNNNQNEVSNFHKDKIIIQNFLNVNDSSSQNNNFHLKLDITNININNGNLNNSSNEKFEKVNFYLTAKIIKDLKDLLRKKNIKFREEHRPNDHELVFKWDHSDKASRKYEIKIETNTLKIMSLSKYKNDNRVMELINEDCKECFLF